MTATNGYGEKLQNRLRSLADNASQESIQTLSNWLIFNRRYASVFVPVLLSSITSTSKPARKMLYLSIVHEIMTANSISPEKWNRSYTLRLLLMNDLVLPIIKNKKELVEEDHKSKLYDMIDEWEAVDDLEEDISSVFTDIHNYIGTSEDEEDEEMDVKSSSTYSSPIRVEQITEEEDVSKESSKKPVHAKEENDTEELNIKEEKDTVAPIVTSSSSPIPPPAPLSNEEDSFNFDFESMETPFKKVLPKEFFEPCKSITMLQIPREIQMDSATRLHDQLQSLPKKVEEYAQQKRLKPFDDAISSDKQPDLTIIPDDVLDLDITESLSEVNQLRSSITQQQQARQKCLDMIFQSKLRFGSSEAAETFYEIKQKLQLLDKNKGLLYDAMELEGLDMEVDDKKKEEEDEILEDFDWL